MRISDWSSDVCSSDLLGSKKGTHFGFGLLIRFRNIGQTAVHDMFWRRLPSFLRCFPPVHLYPFLDSFGRCKGKGDAQSASRSKPNGFFGITRTINDRSEEHTSELQSLMRISYAVFCLKKKKNTNKT